MGGKAKAQKHTAKEINLKHKAAKERAGGAGGGAAGHENRKCQKVGVKCEICLSEFLSYPDMKIHFESRHPKDNFDETKIQAQFQAAKEETSKRRDGKQQGKLDYKQKDNSAAPAAGKPAGGKKAAAEDLAALLAAGVASGKY